MNSEASENIFSIWSATDQEISDANLSILLTLTCIYVVTLAIACNMSPKRSAQIPLRFRDSPLIASVWGILGGLILVANLSYQLSLSDWSFQKWNEFLTGPRFERPWFGSYIGGADFFFTAVRNAFPAAGLLLALAAVRAASNYRVYFLALFTFTIYIYVGNGSRTPVALSLGFLGLTWWVSTRGYVRHVGMGFLCLSCFTLVAIMSKFRDDGVRQISELGDLSMSSYSQDDNYFRLVHIFLTSKQDTADNWNFQEFITASVVNPVPRAIWPNKPLLTAEFYGDWKPFYVTVTFIGEGVAMFGALFGALFAIIFASLLYFSLQWVYLKNQIKGGLVLYGASAFYCYSIMRSIYNIGMNFVFIMTVVMLLALVHRIVGKRLSRSYHSHNPKVGRISKQR